MPAHPTEVQGVCMDVRLNHGIGLRKVTSFPIWPPLAPRINWIRGLVGTRTSLGFMAKIFYQYHGSYWLACFSWRFCCCVLELINPHPANVENMVSS